MTARKDEGELCFLQGKTEACGWLDVRGASQVLDGFPAHRVKPSIIVLSSRRSDPSRSNTGSLSGRSGGCCFNEMVTKRAFVPDERSYATNWVQCLCTGHLKSPHTCELWILAPAECSAPAIELHLRNPEVLNAFLRQPRSTSHDSIHQGGTGTSTICSAVHSKLAPLLKEGAESDGSSQQCTYT